MWSSQYTTTQIGNSRFVDKRIFWNASEITKQNQTKAIEEFKKEKEDLKKVAEAEPKSAQKHEQLLFDIPIPLPDPVQLK
jgi:hypothetical protein